MLQTVSHISNLLLVCHTVSQIGDILHHMTTVFSPFKLLTRGLLQKGWDHFPPKTFSEKSSSCFALTVSLYLYKLEVGLSYYNITRDGQTNVMTLAVVLSW